MIDSADNFNEIRQSEGGYIPFKFFVDFLEFLQNNKDIFEIITYDDLPWGEDYDYLNNYSQERKTWQYELNNEIRDPQKIYVLLQHDVDSIAERTLAILREEERLGIRSNIMIFNRRINRQHLEKTGNLLYTPYELDYDYLIRLQDQYGFVIGYHCNAYERALFDREKALEIFEEDVSALRQHFNIRYFSPHGGPRSSEGLSNNSLEIPDSLRYSLRWVANKRTVRFDRSYSDGGLNSLSRNPADRDLRDFVRMWQRGKRYRVLVHPQYYHSPCEHSPRLAGTPWYEEVLSCYSSSQLATAWNNVHWELKTFKNNLSEFEQSKTTLI